MTKYNVELTSEQNFILKQEGTESPGSSPLNNEKREGKTHDKAMEIAGSSTLGYILSKGLKSLSIVVFGLYIIKLFNNY